MAPAPAPEAREAPEAHPARGRSGLSPALYQQAFVRLLLAALVTFAVILGAAFFYVVPLGSDSPGAVAPVLGRFAQAAADGDQLAMRLQLSTDALQSGRADTLALLGAAPWPLAGYRRLTIDHFERLGPDPRGQDMVNTVARIELEGAAPGQLQAVLVLEGDDWRINDAIYIPPGGAP
jgi:hypothetical protein